VEIGVDLARPLHDLVTDDKLNYLTPIRQHVGRREAFSVILFILTLLTLYFVLSTGWRAGEGSLSLTILTEAPGTPILVEVELPPAFDALTSIPTFDAADAIHVEVSREGVVINGSSSHGLVSVELTEVAPSEPLYNVMRQMRFDIKSAVNASIYAQLIATSETRIGKITSYSNVYAARFDGMGVAIPLFDSYTNEKLRVGDCVVWLSLSISLLVLAVALGPSRIPRFPVVTCILVSSILGLYSYVGTGLDLLVAQHFSAFGGSLTVLILGPLLHSSFSHLFNNLFLGLIPAGLAFETGLRWKSREVAIEFYMAAFFPIHFLIAGIGYPIHGIPPIGASYSVISMSTVLFSLLILFRDRLLSDAMERKIPSRRVWLFAFGAYPLLRGVYDWIGYMIDYQSNWAVFWEGIIHLLVFAFNLFIIYSAKDQLTAQGPILGI